MSGYYCGNDRNSLNGRRLGSRYKCLQIGIGKGRSMPLDPEYLNPYDPIDIRKIYCGKENRLPRGYNYMGNAPLCLQKGIGIGKKQRAEQERDNGGDNYIDNRNMKFRYFLFFISLVIVFSLFYIAKPSFVMKTDKKKKKKINWYKFIFFYILVMIPISVLIFKIG